jgi:hypothetical protein
MEDSVKDMTWLERVVERPANYIADVVMPDIGREAVQQLKAGAHELAAALFSGSGFVMYPRNQGRHDNGHGVHGNQDAPAQDTQEHQQEQGRGR